MIRGMFWIAAWSLGLLLLTGEAGRADEGEDRAVKAIEKFPRQNPRFKRASSLEGMPIISVDLGFTKMTDEGLKELTGLKQLMILYLHRTEVTDAGLKEVARFQQLKSLYLGATRVTDQGLAELRGLKHLRLLDLRFTKVTRDAAMDLQKVLPQLRITHGGDWILEPKN